MYIYNRQLSDSSYRPNEQHVTLRSAQRHDYLASTQHVGKVGKTKCPSYVKKTVCPNYPKGETEIKCSRTREGLLASDVSRHDRGLLIADFGVNWRSVKDSVKKEKSLKEWLNTVMEVIQKDPAARIRIVGYSDCVGEEKNPKAMFLLRRDRARRVRQLLYQLLRKDPRWKKFRSRIIFVGPAPKGEYVDTNSTIKGRARNRGVIIEFYREVKGEPIQVRGRPCKVQLIKKALELLKPGRQLFDEKQRIRLGGTLIRLGWKDGDDRFLHPAGVFNYAQSLGDPWVRVSTFFDRLCVDIAKQAKPLSDMELVKSLQRLDELIIAGLRQLKLERSRLSRSVLLAPLRKMIEGLAKEVAKLMSDNKSIYYLYRNVTP